MPDKVDASPDEAWTRVAVVCGGRSMDGHVHHALATSAGVTIVGDLPQRPETVASVYGLHPDVLVVEADPDDRAALLDLVRRVAVSGFPSPPAVLVVADQAEDGLVACLWRGARGLIVGRPGQDVLAQAIQLVAAGYLVIPKSMRNGALESWISYELPEQTRAAVISKLTPREVSVLKLVAGGHSNAEISSVLRLTESTVKSHIQRILAKLGLRNRIAIVILAHDLGLL